VYPHQYGRCPAAGTESQERLSGSLAGPESDGPEVTHALEGGLSTGARQMVQAAQLVITNPKKAWVEFPARWQV
jgi:hypothetical protein